MTITTPETRTFAPGDALAAAFGWWREAGVDLDYLDETVQWLATEEVEEAVTARPVVQRREEPKQTPIERAFAASAISAEIGGAPDTWPQDIAAFREWWLAEELSSTGAAGRIPPSGVAGAKLMVFVAEPQRDDVDGLLTGGAGRFLAAILCAMGIEQHEVYLASALPAATPLPDWPQLAQSGLGAITSHHATLAAPRRVLAFGRALAPLFDIPPEQARDPAVLRLGDTTLPLMLAPELAELARSPQRRRTFWTRWLEWTA